MAIKNAKGIIKNASNFAFYTLLSFHENLLE